MSFIDTDLPDTSEHFNDDERVESRFLVFSQPEMLALLEETTRGEPHSFGSTPFNPHLNSIDVQQRSVDARHEDLFLSNPHAIRRELISETLDFNASRVHHRRERNFESFELREHYNFDCIPESLREVAGRVITGHGSPAENLVIADILGMPAVELGSVTLGGGDDERMADQEKMRSAITECIRFFDGIETRSFKDPETSTWSRLDDLKIQRENTQLNALHMTSTRLIGGVDGYLIHERSSFLLDVTKLDKEIVEHIQAIPDDEPDRKDAILGVPRFHYAVREAFHNKKFDIAIPIATTCWAVNTKRNAEFINREQRKYHLQRIRTDLTSRDEPLDAHYELLGLD